MDITTTSETIIIQLGINEASFLHAMTNPDYFVSSHTMNDMERCAYEMGMKLKGQLAEFIQKNYLTKENDS